MSDQQPARVLGDVLHALIDSVTLAHESTAQDLHQAVDGYVREELDCAENSTVDSEPLRGVNPPLTGDAS
jgi:hypothetical protein